MDPSGLDVARSQPNPCQAPVTPITRPVVRPMQLAMFPIPRTTKSLIRAQGEKHHGKRHYREYPVWDGLGRHWGLDGSKSTSHNCRATVNVMSIQNCWIRTRVYHYDYTCFINDSRAVYTVASTRHRYATSSSFCTSNIQATRLYTLCPLRPATVLLTASSN